MTGTRDIALYQEGANPKASCPSNFSLYIQVDHLIQHPGSKFCGNSSSPPSVASVDFSWHLVPVSSTSCKISSPTQIKLTRTPEGPEQQIQTCVEIRSRPSAMDHPEHGRSHVFLLFFSPSYIPVLFVHPCLNNSLNDLGLGYPFDGLLALKHGAKRPKHNHGLKHASSMSRHPRTGPHGSHSLPTCLG